MKPLLLIAALGCTASVAQAAQLPILDMDELLFSSDAVVEGKIVRASARNTERLAQVKVGRVLTGDGLRGVVSLDVSLYSKRELGEGTYGELKKRRVRGKTALVFVPFAHQPPQESRELIAGDHAIFFLRNRTKHPFAFEKAPGFAILDSGVRLLRSGRVAGSTQLSNPGGYDELPSLPRAVFDAGFAASRARVAALRAHLSRPARLEDATYLEVWSAWRRAKTAGVAGGWGALSNAINGRLAQIHKLKRSQTR